MDVRALRLAAILVILSASLRAADLALDRALSSYNHTDYFSAVSILKQAPADSANLQLLGKCYFMQSEYKRATETFEKAIAIDPSNSMLYTWLGRSFGRRAETSFPVQALSYAQRTRESFEKAVQLDAKNGEAVNDLFEFYLQAPALVGGGTEKARNLLPLIAKIDPVEVHFARARLAEEKKQFDEAEVQFRMARELAPNQIGRILDLAKFISKRGRYEDAERLFEQAERLNPEAPQTAIARAQSYLRAQRKLDEAQTLIRKYLASPNITPDDPPKSEALKLLKKAQGN